MPKKILVIASFWVLFISCFAATVSYCQQPATPYNTDQQDFFKVFANYLPGTTNTVTDGIPAQKSTSAILITVPYLLLSDSLLTIAETPDEVIGYIVININDSLNLNDSISLVANDADSLDNKEANTNSITLPELAAAKSAVTYDGTTNAPPSLADKKIDRLINKYAEMISLEPEDVKNYPLYKFINDWYGVKYKWGGTDNSGIDCSAFSQKLYGKIYSTDIKRTARQQHRNSEKIKDYGEANEGDLVFFRIHHIRITHVGVYLANGYFVHASRSHGVVISNLDDKYWRSRYAGCGRIAKQDRQATESDFVQ